MDIKKFRNEINKTIGDMEMQVVDKANSIQNNNIKMLKNV
jgi:hypothetical protein